MRGARGAIDRQPARRSESGSWPRRCGRRNCTTSGDDYVTSPVPASSTHSTSASLLEEFAKRHTISWFSERWLCVRSAQEDERHLRTEYPRQPRTTQGVTLSLRVQGSPQGVPRRRRASARIVLSGRQI